MNATFDFNISKEHEIEKLFIASIKRLNLGSCLVQIDDNNYPGGAATHPFVILPRLAHRAEELAILLLNRRLFSGIVYLVNQDRPSGIEIIEESRLSSEQKSDVNIQEMLKIEVASINDITHGIRCLISDMAVTDVLSPDLDKKLLILNEPNWKVHGLNRDGQDFSNGDSFPLLAQDYIALSEFDSLLSISSVTAAIEKAKRKAEDLVKRNKIRYEGNKTFGDL